jgi:tetratricopeptide (TPR) repeat protein
MNEQMTEGPVRSTELNDLVKRGLVFQSQGDLESAGRIYGEILTADGQRADALHLFGVVMSQLGDHLSAIKAISRAIALRPNIAHFHVNLGEIYHVLGNVDRSAACLFLALKLRPDGFQNPADFDLLIQRPGQFDNVQLPGRPPLGVAPAASVEHTETALRLRAQGDRAGAFDHFVKAMKSAPGVGMPHSNLGQALLEIHRVEEAFFHGNEAVRLAPEYPEHWNHLGNIQRAMGQSLEARSSYLEALRLAPDMAVAQNNLGRELLAALCPHEALVWFRMALEFDPTSDSIRSNIASALKEIGQLEEAVAFSEESVALAPLSEEAHLIHGSILHELRRFEDAARSFREAIRLNPDLVGAHESLGVLLTEMGDLEGAERSLREVLCRPGDHTRSLMVLTNIYRAQLPEADFAAIRKLLADPALPESLRADLHYASAQVEDARGDYPRAAENLRRANAIKHAQNRRAGRSYRPEDHEEFIEQMMAICSAEFFERVEGFGLPTTRPVFIFGLPRSGTSLTEQILASHSCVHGLGETEFARMSFESLSTTIRSPSKTLECLGDLDRDTTLWVAREHLAGLDAIDRETRYLVDKMTDNYLYLGFLATLFPQARFIHCRRDLRDLAVSCWATNFWYLDWPNNLDHIASRFTMHEHLMAHWESVLPVPILHLDYEQTVNDLETTARTLVDWCGLDWEPACLDFHKSKRVVRTASVTQVRKPIYRRSVERWRNYETELGPLFERLESEVKV